MNNQLRLRKANPEGLRSIGLDESWLQDQIESDPSLLGLGELHVIQREKRQPTGGRIDFLMLDQETETRYEIEVMLGPVDESHIIRTIEYWDVERQRYPTLEHRAVIVAEEITSRFFNVIRLLNRAVPIMAIQLSAFRFGDEVVLHFTTVLDTYEFGAEPEDEEPGDPVDKAYWAKKANPESLAVVEAIHALASSEDDPVKIVFTKDDIRLRTTSRRIFCFFRPRKKQPFSVVRIRVDQREEILNRFEEAGILPTTKPGLQHSLYVKLTIQDIDKNKDLVLDVIRKAREFSHRNGS